MGIDTGTDTPEALRHAGGEVATPGERRVSQHEVKAIGQVTDRLADRFGALPRAQVTRVVAEVHHAFDHAHIRDFVPILVEREARHRLTQPEAQVAAD